MSISVYSVVMAIIWFSFAALIGSFALRKISKGGLLFITLILALALLRMFIPLDFDNSIVIRSKYCYPFLQKFVRMRIVREVTIGIILASVWIIGALIRMGIVVHKLVLLQRFRKQCHSELSEGKLVALCQEICEEINFTDNKIRIFTSTIASTAYQAGFLHPYIILPANINTFSEDEICHMLRHELCHFLGKDLWIKLCFQIITCFLWWNPVMIPLNQSIEQMLELRCDHHVCTKLTEEEQLVYLETLIHLAKYHSNELLPLSLGYIGSNDSDRIIQRFEIILSDKSKRIPDRQVIIVILLCILLFLISYLFILQPWTEPPSIVENSPYVSTTETAYIVKTSGQYEFYIDGNFICSLYKEELAQEPFCNCIIYEGGIPNEEIHLPDY